LKRSRIICSIITVIYIILSVAICLICIKNNFETESSVGTCEKLIYVGTLAICVFAYVWVRNKLSKKMSNKDLSIKVSKIYCYLYLAVIVLVSRIVMAYVLKNEEIAALVPSFNMGLGSYLNYGLGIYIGNQMYANVIINTILIFLSSVVIKKIVLNITDNDMVATTTSLLYIFAPQSLWQINSYIRYNYNVLIVLIGIYVLLNIIDEVKNFNKKNNKYLIYSLVLGGIQTIDIVFGGSYMLWLCPMPVITCIAMYVDIVHILIPFKQELNYKMKRIVEKIERINISKLVYVCGISLGVSAVTTCIYLALSSANKFSVFNVQNAVAVIGHSRSYYLVLVIIALVFEIISVITKRKLDIKMNLIKLMFIVAACITFFMVDGIYASALFDTLLILNTIMIICNICYNGEERIKLLKEKN